MSNYRNKRWFALSVSIVLPMSLVVFISQADPSLKASYFIEEVTTGLPEINTIAADSLGYLFLGANNDVYRSVDSGATWTKVLDMINQDKEAPRLLFVNSLDYVFALMFDTSNYYDLYRSIDHGMSWIRIMDNVPCSWHMSEAPNGDLYFNTYSYTSYIYKSTDEGASFSVFYNLTGIVDHFHWVEVSPGGKIYVATGDGPYDATIQRYNEVTGLWDVLANTTATGEIFQTVPIFFDNDYAYFMGDGQRYCYRMPNSGTSANDFEIIFDLYAFRVGPTNFAYEGAFVNNVYWLGTDNGQLWASWDGKHWVKLSDEGIDDRTFFSVTRRGFPLFFVETLNNKLYRISAKKEDIIHLYYSEYNLHRGSITNAENYVYEQRLWNGTNYLNLADVGLSNVQASIKGLSRVNNLNDNAGFEWNNMTGWATTGSLPGTVVSETSANGTYSFRVIKSASDPQVNSIRGSSPFAVIESKRGDVAILSFYAKANVSDVNTLQVQMFNGTGGSPIHNWDNIKLTTGWKRYTFWHAINLDNIPSISWIVYYKKADVTTWLDSVMWYIDQTQILYGMSGATESISYVDGFMHPSYFGGGFQNTLNPNLTIEGEIVSYSGTLINGTESTPINLVGIKSGVIPVNAVIGGSGQAILRITGTRLFTASNIVLKGYRDSWFYGRCFGTPTFSAPQLVALTNVQADIASLSYASNKLTLTVDSLSGTNSTSKIYCGDKGEPRAIWVKNGTLFWSYNASTMTLTLEVAHLGLATIIIDWRIPGDVNGDGVVNTNDLKRVNEAYGSVPEKTTWDEDADLNRDEKINVFDLFLVGINYGKIKP